MRVAANGLPEHGDGAFVADELFVVVDAGVVVAVEVGRGVVLDAEGVEAAQQVVRTRAASAGCHCLRGSEGSVK